MDPEWGSTWAICNLNGVFILDFTLRPSQHVIMVQDANTKCHQMLKKKKKRVGGGGGCLTPIL